MSKPISIGVASDTREFTRNIKSGVIDPLEDAGKSLDDVQRAGDKAGEELEGAFEKAQKEVSNFKKEQADAARDTAKKWKTASDSVGDDMKHGMAEASEGSETLKENVGANAKEMAASFDGSVDGMVGGLQGLIAEMTEGFGPAGLIAGVAAAAGIGIAVAQGQKLADALNAAKERAGELALEIIAVDGDLSQVDIGGKMREWGVEIADNREWWELWQESAVSNIDKARTAADKYGLSMEDLFRGLSGLDADATASSLDDINRAIEENLELQADNGDANLFANWELDQRLQELYGLQSQLETTQDVIGDAANASRDLAAATADETRSAQEATAAQEQRAGIVGAVNTAYDAAAGKVTDFINSESGLFDVQAYVDSMNARSQALSDYQTDILSSGLTPEAIAFLNEQGVESASQMLAGYKSAAPNQRADLNRIWTEAGNENSGEYKKALDTGLPKSVKGPKIVAEADFREANSDFNAFAKRDRTMTIRARIVDDKGRVIYQ